MTDSVFTSAALASYGIAAFGYFAFAVRLALGWRRSSNAGLLLAATIATLLWAAFNVLVAIELGVGAWLLASVGDTVRYALWFLFLDRILRTAQREVADQPLPPLVPNWSLVAAFLAVTASLVLPVGIATASSVDGYGTSMGFGLRLGLAVFGLIMVEQLMRRAHAEARWAIKPLCIGLGGMFGFDLYFYADAMMFNQMDQNIWLARGIANALVIPLIAVATARNTGWTIDIHMSRSAVFHSTALLLSGIFVLAIAAAGYIVRYIGGELGTAMQIAFSFAAIIVAIYVVSSGRFHSELRVFVSKHFFSYRYDYRAEWLRFTQTLSLESSVQSVEERCIKALADLVESPAGVLWLRKENDTFAPTNRWNAAVPVNAMEPASSVFARFLGDTGWVIDLVEYAEHRSRYRDLVIPEWMSAIPSAWLVVPLVSGNELVGFIVLTTPRARVDVNWEVIDLLKTASRQAASYIGEAGTTEALLEARKFAAFNRMSAFVVHDLKNLVAQLSLLLKNAERHHDNPEFQRDMVSTVAHVVGRMNHLMLQLRTGATPIEKPRIVDLERIVRRVCAALVRTSRPVRTELTTGLATVGHEDQLDHVFGHLLQNALDATAGGGDVTVALVPGAPGTVILEVADTGVGMSPEFMGNRLYKPFETTKASGMGIGVYESAQYVRGIGGDIHIDSAPGKGTRVRVVLPTAESPEQPAQQPQAVT